MARRRQSGLDLIAAMPWPVGIVLGVVAHLTIRVGIPAYLSGSDSTLFRAAGQQAASGVFEPLAWLALILCWIAAGASFVRSRHRKNLLRIQTGLQSIDNLTWREFEMLVGEAYRHRGYNVDETGLGGADGGIDLILQKDGCVELVQCKQWRNRQVKAAVAREMWGLRAHHGADAVKIVCIGEFTRDAKAFADGKAIDLVNGERLLELVQEGQAILSHSVRSAQQNTASAQHVSATCPVCQGDLVLRTNRTSGQQFWGCSAFPRCRGTRPA